VSSHLRLLRAARCGLNAGSGSVVELRAVACLLACVEFVSRRLAWEARPEGSHSYVSWRVCSGPNSFHGAALQAHLA
jgi:hypothetical protein